MIAAEDNTIGQVQKVQGSLFGKIWHSFGEDKIRNRLCKDL